MGRMSRLDRLQAPVAVSMPSGGLEAKVEQLLLRTS